MKGEEAVMDDTTEKCLILKQSEINALKKLIMYVKFECEETESLLYAGSPIINNFFEKLLEIDDLKESSHHFYSQRNIDNEKFIQTKIQREQKETPNKSDEGLKLELFKACLYPFTTSEDV